MLSSSGDAGTGKSFLFTTIIQAANHVLREEGDTIDQPRVLSLAPSMIIDVCQKIILIILQAELLPPLLKVS